ncbi:MAG: hypothetical protein U0T84_03970 [Chitinophagales bacterium]
MKLIRGSFLLLVCLWHTSGLLGQILIPESERTSFFTEEQRLSRNGMIALTTWGSANVISGAVAAPLTSGSWRYFNLMNIAWGAANVGIGVPALIIGARDKSVPGSGNLLRKQQRRKELFLINGALDFAYLGAGAALWGFSNRTKQPLMMTGFGQSLLVQGGWLLAFDWTMYLLHAHHGRILDRYLTGLSYTGTGFRYQLAF